MLLPSTSTYYKDIRNWMTNNKLLFYNKTEAILIGTCPNLAVLPFSLPLQLNNITISVSDSAKNLGHSQQYSVPERPSTGTWYYYRCQRISQIWRHILKHFKIMLPISSVRWKLTSQLSLLYSARSKILNVFKSKSFVMSQWLCSNLPIQLTSYLHTALFSLLLFWCIWASLWNSAWTFGPCSFSVHSHQMNCHFILTIILLLKVSEFYLLLPICVHM